MVKKKGRETGPFLILEMVSKCKENFAKPIDKYTWQCYSIVVTRKLVRRKEQLT